LNFQENRENAKKETEMANKNLFRSAPQGQTPAPADAVTHHGTPAYQRAPKHALAQFAVTGCFSDTYYVKSETQLQEVLNLCADIDPQFVAQCAVYSRKVGHMKDAPAFLAAYLAQKDVRVLKRIFHTVMDNPKMLRNFVQIIRSGVIGRKSLGTAPKKLVQQWIGQRSNEQLFRASVGKDPSLSDIIKMVHPKPLSKEQEATLSYITRTGEKEQRELPKLIQQYEDWKKDPEGMPVPAVPWEMLTAHKLSTKVWKDILRNAGWQMIRMNLNTFERHDVFKDKDMVKLAADRLRDEKEIEKARVFPYQIMVAYMNYDGRPQIKEALQDALEIATKNVPVISSNVALAVDVSGSMSTPITGQRGSATSKVTCIDVASLFAACILRKNPLAQVLPFNDNVILYSFNPRDSVITNAVNLAKLCNNGTNCSAPLALINKKRLDVDTVIYISDNESWMDLIQGIWIGSGPCRQTAPLTMQCWNEFKVRKPNAKMVCIDLTPTGTLQAKNQKDVLNIGGFSDNVFGLVADFVDGKYGENYWVEQIEKIDICNLDSLRN
jgi:60 kDa SS-A/Ro ribonucleoprotein